MKIQTAQKCEIDGKFTENFTCNVMPLAINVNDVKLLIGHIYDYL